MSLFLNIGVLSLPMLHVIHKWACVRPAVFERKSPLAVSEIVSELSSVYISILIGKGALTLSESVLFISYVFLGKHFIGDLLCC